MCGTHYAWNALFQPQYTCTHVQLFALYSKATWRSLASANEADYVR
jgi:hypothetical protein